MNIDLSKYREIKIGEKLEPEDVNWNLDPIPHFVGCECVVDGTFYRPLTSTTLCSHADLATGDAVAVGITAMFHAKHAEAINGGASHWEANIRAMEFLQGMIGRHLWAMATRPEAL